MSNERNRILLVEDNPDDEILTIRALRKSNVANEVDVARDGTEAMEYLFGEEDDGRKARERVRRVQLVLLDLKLPKVDGLEVLERIRAEESTHRLPVVILTSSDEESDLMRSYDLGANSYVCKPVDFSHFAEAVRRLGLYWLVINRAPPE